MKFCCCILSVLDLHVYSGSIHMLRGRWLRSHERTSFSIDILVRMLCVTRKPLTEHMKMGIGILHVTQHTGLEVQGIT